MLLKCFTQYASKFGKLSSGHRTGKVVFIAIPKNGNFKKCATTIQLHSSHMLPKQVFLQASLQQCMCCEIPYVQAEFRNSWGTRDQIANIHWITEKAREFQKNASTSAILTTSKPLMVWITTNSGKLRDGNTRPSYLPSEKSVCRSRSNS